MLENPAAIVKILNTGVTVRREPVGTNLLTAYQAKEIVEYMLAGTICTKNARKSGAFGCGHHPEIVRRSCHFHRRNSMRADRPDRIN